jgi:hypothetical protein
MAVDNTKYFLYRNVEVTRKREERNPGSSSCVSGGKDKLKIKLIAIANLLLICLLSSSCVPSRDFDTRLSLIVKPYRFSIANGSSALCPVK